jgi:hypothetical protein
MRLEYRKATLDKQKPRSGRNSSLERGEDFGWPQYRRQRAHLADIKASDFAQFIEFITSVARESIAKGKPTV